jgi:hypothetical protein
MLNVTLAGPQRHKSLSLFPLLAQDAPELPYSLMAEALQHGVLRIAEVGSGTVPELLAINTSDSAILVLDGEQLVGARQNRTTNRSLLLPPRSETKIPVSCMEQGRWYPINDQFAPTPHSSPSVVRRQAREAEAEIAVGGAAVPMEVLRYAQGNVWDAIADHSAKLRSGSETGALNDLYSTRAGDLEEWVRKYPREPGQVGLLAFLGGRPLGMDLIGCTGLFAKLHDRLLRGYIMDALGSSARSRKVEGDTAQRYLDQVVEVRRVESPTVGLGCYAVLSGTVIGGELTESNQVVHLSAFPAIQGRRGSSGADGYNNPIAPPSRRRRRSE